jgi:excisionase family DNA binding protein
VQWAESEEQQVMTAEIVSALAYSRREAAKAAGISLTALDDAIRRGQFPSIRVGRRVLIPKSAFLRILEAGSAN